MAINDKINAAAARRLDPRFPGFYVGTTDADGDFDGALDADIRSVGGSSK